MAFRVTPEYNLAARHPELAKEWSGRNQRRTCEYTPHSAFKAWWRCAQGHEWQAYIYSRVAGRNCPCCDGKVTTPERNLATLLPNIAAEWSPLNEKSSADFLPHSRAKVLWICARGHVWRDSIDNRTRSRGCKRCLCLIPTPEHNLAILYPALAAQWSPRNPKLASDYMPKARTKVLWLCHQGHEWSAAIYSRVRSNGCERCSGKIPTPEHNLATLYPSLVAGWSPLNEKSPSSYAAKSNFKARWLCAMGHTWQATIASRAFGSGCPRCASDQIASAPERALVAALVVWLGQAPPSLDYATPHLHWPRGGAVIPDFVVDSGPIKLALEYDGARFHSKNTSIQSDHLKTKLLRDAGFLVLRIREAPLPVFHHDFDLVLDPSTIYPEKNQGFPSLIQASQSHIDSVCRREFGDPVWSQFLATSPARQALVHFPIRPASPLYLD